METKGQIGKSVVRKLQVQTRAHLPQTICAHYMRMLIK